MKTNLCIIPLRSNSKRLKNKNIRKINSVPLCIYSIDQAIRSNIFDKVIIACDSIKYFEIIGKYFKKKNPNYIKKIKFFLRSKKNSQPNSQTELVLLEVLKEESKYKYIFMIQATSPLILSKDIRKCEDYLINKNFDSVFSSYNDHKFVWKKEKNIKPINYKVQKRPMKQKFKNNLFIENGAIYAFKYKKFIQKKVRLFGKIGTFLMPKNRSLDIDTENDLQIFSNLIKKKYDN